jgi:hypothetical protein
MRRVHGHVKRTKRCHARLISGTISFTTAPATARLTRNGRLYASGDTRTIKGRRVVVLVTRRPLRHGRYTLTLRYRTPAAGARTARATITIRAR